MTKRIGVVGLVFALASLVLAQVQVSNTSGGLYNGHFWQKLSTDSKLTFLMGFLDGLMIGYAEASPGTVESKGKALRASQTAYGAVGVSYEDMIKGIDGLYDDPANVMLPIPIVMKVFTLRATGATQSAVETALAGHRQFYSKKTAK